jgi:hypothetical protein
MSTTPAKKAVKAKAKPTHPPTSTMVLAAVKALKERNGSSLPAIKKYIAANYKVDVVKLAPFIKKALKSLVEKKKLVQTKGVGASGSFKLASAVKGGEKAVSKPKKAKSPKKKPAAKKAVEASEKKAPVKKTPKKKVAAKKPASAKKAKVAKKPAAAKKSPAKKAKKSPKKKTAAKK